MRAARNIISARFQSTLPARGATQPAEFIFDRNNDFNPRSPHGERPVLAPDHNKHFTFQSTLPARGATICWRKLSPAKSFQSTLPARGATRTHLPTVIFPEDFNPRSPHGERQPSWATSRRFAHFNPRSPHGERLRKVTILSIRIIGFAQKVYHKTVLLRISLAENAVILPEKPRNPVRTSLQKAGGLRFARAIRAARPYSISSPSGA